MEFKALFKEQPSLKTSFSSSNEQFDAGMNSVVKGKDGFSPVAYVVQDEDGATISITDLNGTTSAKVKSADPERVENLEKRVAELELGGLNIMLEFID